MTKLIFSLLITLALAATAALADTNTVKGVTKSKVQLVDAAKAEELIAAKKVVVLDVRTAAEFASGHIGGATNLDF